MKKIAENLNEQNFIPLCEPYISGNEWNYIKSCLDDNWVSSIGKYVDEFEKKIAEYTNSLYAIATVNGTAALHISLLICGIKPNDEILTSNLTFISPANAIRYVGAWPVFIDAEPNHWQIDIDKLTDFITNKCKWENGSLINKISKRIVTAILPVNILGHPIDIDSIKKIADKYNLKIIEDCTESLGAKYYGKISGSVSNVSCFSFNGNKLITTGGGGMIVTNDQKLAEYAKHLTTQAKSPGIEYIYNEIGYNYRLTNLQAAMGVAQMEKIDQFINSKIKIAKKYNSSLQNIPSVTTMKEASWAESVWWMYTILVGDHNDDSSRKLLDILDKQNIQTRPIWQPMHLSPVHFDSQSTDCSVSEILYKKGLSLPCSVGLNENDQNSVISKILLALDTKI